MPTSSPRPPVLFSRLFEKTDVGILVVDLEATIVQASEAFQRMTGFAHEELTDLSLWVLTHPEDVAASRKQFAEMVEGRLPHFLTERRYSCKDGSYVLARTRCNLLHDHKGSVTHVAALIELVEPAKGLADSPSTV